MKIKDVDYFTLHKLRKMNSEEMFRSQALVEHWQDVEKNRKEVEERMKNEKVLLTEMAKRIKETPWLALVYY